ncbi:MAG: Tryptophan synthase alpha chain [bacterium]|nr:Tryptophan synthase alpha chain [bacterium]
MVFSRNIAAVFIILFLGLASGCGDGSSPNCALPTVRCSDTQCHNLDNDPAHCGRCGNSCPAAGQVCSGGVCSSSCASGTIACSGSCVDLQTDVHNCGACENICTSANGSPICVAGACAAGACDSGFFSNGSTCQACSAACAAGQHETASCSATSDRACASCTVIPNCAAETCTTSTDQVCAACSSGLYLSGDACVACSTTACPSGEYQSAACSATADRTCSSCTAIANCTAELCTTASDQVCSACGAGTYLGGNSCNACSGTCPAGEIQATACSGTADRTCVAAPDCYAIHVAVPSLTDGVYTLDPDGPGGADPFPAYCDMTHGGGGWTLLMKIDGTQTTFSYASAYWTNGTTYQPTQYAYDTTNETKLYGFNNMPLNAMRLGMYDPTDSNSRWLEIPRVNSSLAELFTSGYQATSLGRDAWESLLSSPSLQLNCNLEGFNTSAAGTRARIGIVANQEPDCNSPDSRIGIGTDGANCGQNPLSSSGDEAYCTPDHGVRSTATFGYVMVRDCPGGVCQCGTLTSCNAICVDVSTNRQACGSCTNSCGSQNAVGTCTNGVCVEVCTAGFADCDNNPSTGCEANLSSDLANCGSCGTQCGVHQRCDLGTCTDIPALTIVNPNGQTVEYLPRNGGGQFEAAEGTCSTNCTVYPTTGNMGGVRLRAPNGFASGCNQVGYYTGHCYVSTPATVVLN